MGKLKKNDLDQILCQNHTTYYETTMSDESLTLVTIQNLINTNKKT